MTSERLEILDGTGRVHRISRAHLPVLRVLAEQDVTVPELPERIGVTIDVARHLMNQLRDRSEVVVLGMRGRSRRWILSKRGWDLAHVLERAGWMENR